MKYLFIVLIFQGALDDENTTYARAAIVPTETLHMCQKMVTEVPKHVAVGDRYLALCVDKGKGI